MEYSRPPYAMGNIFPSMQSRLPQFPIDGLAQAEAAVLAYGGTLTFGDDVIVYGTNSLISAFTAISGIIDIEIRIDDAPVPTTDNNVVVGPREIAVFDSARITIIEV